MCRLEKSNIVVGEIMVNPYFNSDGSEIISSLGDKIVIWDSETGNIVRQFEVPSMLPSFSPDGKYIIYTSIHAENGNIQTNGVKVIDAITGRLIISIDPSHPTDYTMTYAMFSPNGKWIALYYGLGEDRNEDIILLYDAKTGDLIRTLKTDILHIPTICSFSPDDKQYMYIYHDNIYVCDIMQKNEILSWKSNENVNTVQMRLQGDVIVSTSIEGTIAFWDATTGDEVKRLQSRHNVKAIRICPTNNNIMASISGDSIILIWDVNKSSVIDSLVAHSKTVNSIEFSPDGKYLISASDDCDVIIWDFSERRVISKLEGDKIERHLILFSHFEDRKQFAAFLSEKGKVLIASKLRIIIEDIFSNDTIRIFSNKDTTEYVDACFTSVSINHKGDMVVAASDDGTLKVWNINEDEMRFSMIGHEKNINSLHFSTDDRYLVSTADDGTLKIWDVSIGQEIFTFKYDVSQINYAEFNYDGRKIITAMSDGMIKVLKFTPFQEIVDSVRIYFKNYPLTLEERKQFFLE